MIKRIRTSRLSIKKSPSFPKGLPIANTDCPTCADLALVAEVLVGLATDTTVYLSRRGKALKVDKLTFTIRASDSMAPWAKMDQAKAIIWP